MNIYKIKDLPVDERDTLLKGESSEIVENETYIIPMNEVEIAIAKDELTKASVDKSYLEEEIDEARAEFKARMEPLKTKISEAIEQMRTRQRKVVGRVYHMPDHENNMVHVISEHGHVLNSRPMKPEERQMRITTTAKAV